MAAIFLDTGPLSLITHPRDERREEARRRLLTLLDGESFVVLPEIADYEHRRKLLHLESRGSLRHRTSPPATTRSPMTNWPLST